MIIELRNEFTAEVETFMNLQALMNEYPALEIGSFEVRGNKLIVWETSI